MVEELLLHVRRRVTAALVVGLLTFGAPAPRSTLTELQPPVVRIRVISTPSLDLWLL